MSLIDWKIYLDIENIPRDWSVSKWLEKSDGILFFNLSCVIKVFPNHGIYNLLVKVSLLSAYFFYKLIVGNKYKP